ncbi:hypothetical protein MFFC18_41650 [Mariniblastus fucicola]|uniref:Uncharacterized protein n=1 Tax=Mariniblastus fucicola TaxID=980251 RepID=A0A5B9PBZ1_9BACT|nr:hypothetical protein MFFC18_41650 [Mariniblastus fucicola]
MTAIDIVRTAPSPELYAKAAVLSLAGPAIFQAEPFQHPPFSMIHNRPDEDRALETLQCLPGAHVNLARRSQRLIPVRCLRILRLPNLAQQKDVAQALGSSRRVVSKKASTKRSASACAMDRGSYCMLKRTWPEYS